LDGEFPSILKKQGGANMSIEIISQNVGLFFLKIIFFPLWLLIKMYDIQHTPSRPKTEDYFFIPIFALGIILNIGWFRMFYASASKLKVQSNFITFSIIALVVIGLVMFIVPLFIGFKDEDDD
jgi:hypothetical protein